MVFRLKIVTIEFVALVVFKQIANILEISLSTTKMRCYGAIEKLMVASLLVSKYKDVQKTIVTI